MKIFTMMQFPYTLYYKTPLEETVMKFTALKISASSVAACALCAVAFGASMAMTPANAQDQQGIAPVIEAASSDVTSTLETALTDEQIAIEPVGQYADVPAVEEEVIEHNSLPLATVENNSPAQPEPLQTEQPVAQPVENVSPAPAPVPTPAPAAVPEQPASLDFVVDAAYMVDGEKMYYRGNTGGYYEFEGEEVAGDGWGLGSSWLSVDAATLSTMKIEKI